jgi:hypothetical protein
VEDVNGSAVRTDVVGEVLEFTFGAGISPVVAVATLLALKGSFAKANM